MPVKSTASQLLRQARLARGITQSKLAAQAHTQPSDVCRAEAGRTDISSDKLDDLLAAVDYGLYALPYTRPPLAAYALSLREALRDSPAVAYRIVLQFNNDLVGASAVERTVLCAAPAPTTGSDIHDVLLASLAEYRLSEVHAPIPSWIAEVGGLKEAWYVDSYAERHREETASQTPEPFRRRNAFVPAVEFESCERASYASQTP